MKRIFLVTATILLSATVTQAQRFYTKNGMVAFFSATNIENIKADNNQVLCTINAQTGDLQFSLMNKGFHFAKALMEEHFNENYIESTKFPKSTFKGTIADISKVNFAADGTYAVSVTGDINMHGVTKTVTVPGTVTVKGGKPAVAAKFMLKLADYGITIPGAVKKNISESVEITVNCLLDQKL